MLLLGIGGVLVEVYQDVSLRRCPINHDEAHEMIDSLQGARLLHGYRGHVPADVDALARTLVAVSHMAVHLEDVLAELDINPLLVLPDGEGVVGRGRAGRVGPEARHDRPAGADARGC